MGDPGVDVMGKKSVLRTNFPFLMMWRTNEDMNKGLEQRDYESLNFLTNQRPGPPERKKTHLTPTCDVNPRFTNEDFMSNILYIMISVNNLISRRI